MKKIVILDHGNQEVIICNYNEEIWDCPEDMTDENGNYRLDSNCEWMIIDDFNIKIENEIHGRND